MKCQNIMKMILDQKLNISERHCALLELYCRRLVDKAASMFSEKKQLLELFW